jgi:Tfp pilus assembly protein PilF
LDKSFPGVTITAYNYQIVDRRPSSTSRKILLPGLLLSLLTLACALTDYAIPGQEMVFDLGVNPVQTTARPIVPTKEQTPVVTMELDRGREALSLGIALRDSRNYELALIKFDEAIESDPLLYDAYYQRGSTKLDLDDVESAMSDFNLAIAIDPGRAEAYNGRGVAYTKMERYEEAFNELEVAIQLKSNFSEAYNNRGIVYVELGEISVALEDFTQAIEFQPDNAEAYHNRGLARLNLGFTNQALEDFQMVMSLSNDPELLKTAEERIKEISVGQ